MKHTFEDVAKEYPDLETSHIIVDNCAHQMVKNPEHFDVIVTTNMNGDILSDLGSALIGGLGFAPGANIGDTYSIFEAVHGSAPDIAGQNIVNPTAILLSAVLMLRHLKEFEAAHAIEQSLLYTLGIQKLYPRDLDKSSTVTTTSFTEAVIQNLGKETNFWQSRPYKPLHLAKIKEGPKNVLRQDVGVDVYIESDLSSETLGASLEKISLPSPFFLKMISNRAIQVYPAIANISVDTVDH